MTNTPRLRVAKATKSIESSDPNDFVFREDLNTLKVKATGTLDSGETVAHGLAYIPITFSVVKFSSTKSGIVSQIATAGASVDATNLNANSDIKYYIFYEEGV